MDFKQRVGLKFLIISGVILNLFFVLGQTMSIVNYDFTVSIGMQEPISEITAVGVAFNKGFGAGDTVVYIPLFITGIIGVLKRRAWGLFAMFGALAITVYWPIVCMAALFYAKGAPGWHFADYTAYSIFLSIITIYGLWGLWYLYKNRKELFTV